MPSKKCSVCQIEKSLDEFFADKAKKDGKASSCKPCSKARAKKWAQENRDRYNATSRARDHREWEDHKAKKKAWRDANRESVNARNKAWRNANPETQKASVDRWSALNSSRRRETRKEHYAKNRDRYAENARAWAAANIEKIRSYRHRRRAREESAQGVFSGEDVAEILALQKHRCAVCACRLGSHYHIDHIYALSKGGSNERSNIQILCATCNRRKSAKDPIDFAQENGFLL